MESSPRWFDDVVVAFLKEQAELGHMPGHASPRATAAAAALAGGGGQWTAQSLDRAGYDFMSTHLAPEAVAYFQASLPIRESLWKDNPRNVQIADGLGLTLNNLGTLLRADGRVEPAETAYRRSVEISEPLWKDNPRNVQIGDGLGSTLNNLGTLLSADGRVEPAETAYRRSVEIREALWKDNPTHIEIKAGYAGSLSNVGRWDEAERLVDEVLVKVPRHPYANQLKRYIAAKRPRSGSGAMVSDQAAAVAKQPWWKRWLGDK